MNHARIAFFSFDNAAGYLAASCVDLQAQRFLCDARTPLMG